MPYPVISLLEQTETAVSRILKSFSARLTGWLSIQHNDDGSHAAVTATSVTISGALSAASAAITGAITGASLAVTGAITAASAAISGAITGASLVTTGLITAGTTLIAGTTVAAGTTVTAGTSIFERGRSTALGEWITPTVTDANFRGSATGDADWVVNVPGDVSTFKYMLVGKTMFFVGEILTSDVANAPLSLIADIPGGFTCNMLVDAFCRITDAGVRTTGSVQITSGGTTMVMTRADAALLTNTGGAGNTAIRWEIFFEVQ